jgi:dipeptidyl aminopeptidase/acylaminoacyl peptidase
MAVSSFLLLVPLAASAQGTLEDYRRAATINERFTGLTVGLIGGGGGGGRGGGAGENAINWIDNTNQFWYRVSVTGGNQFVRVDPDAWSKQPAFDHARLASGLSAVTNQPYTAVTLPFQSFTYVDSRQAIQADFGNARYRCSLTDYTCTRSALPQPGGDAAAAGGGRGAGGRRGGGRGGGPRGGQGEEPETSVRSPDERTEACIRNHNIAVRPVPVAGGGGRGGRGGAGGAGGRGGGGGPATCPNDPNAVMLSFDGSEGDAYQFGSIEWSPDSKKLVAYRRKPGYTRSVHYVRSSPAEQVQPLHETLNYRKPGDLLDFNQPVIFDVATKKQTFVNNTLFPNAYQITRAVWRKDGQAYTFQYNQRGHMVYRVLEADATTGNVRAIVDEQTKSFFAYRPAVAGLSDTGHNYSFDVGGACQFTDCDTYDGKEIIWMSERDGWAHLYLYDGATGRVKNQITKGQWVVKSVDSVDVANRQIYFRALGMNRNQDPYFVHFYRINFDGTGLVTYTEADGSHNVVWSPDRKYYVDMYSRVDLPTVAELRRASDRRLLPLEKGDMSAQLATGWRPPEVFVAKGRDGVTDIWGIIVRPFTFDPNRKYPVIEQIYAGPQGSFVPKTWGGGAGLLSTAELGFVLVQIDGMGTNNRSKAFHDVAWKNLADAGFPDRIAWHKAVAAKYPWYDISRVGVYGGSAGGQNAAGAVLFHSDFYDAAFASSGCHDNRMDKIWWNEHWMGEMGPHYAASSNVTNAHRLKGRLFLAVGEMDTNVDPSSTMQVVDALIRAGKDFDLLVVPNGGHGATGPDGTRRRNDFFVRWLMGVTPPDWNSGITLNNTQNGDLDFPPDQPPPYGFFDDPNHDLPPYWWW